VLAATDLLDTQHVAVTRKIVELVDVDSVAVVAHDVVKEVLPVPTLDPGARGNMYGVEVVS
jgi:hypothetical protein